MITSVMRDENQKHASTANPPLLSPGTRALT